MNHWKSLILAGNHYYSQNELGNAEDAYFDALTLLAGTYDALFYDKEALSAWLACHHNLSAVYKRHQQRDLALFHLESPIRTLEAQLKKTPPEHQSFVDLLKAYSSGLSELCAFHLKQKCA